MTRIVLADDHAILRDGLSELIDRHEGLQIVGTAGDGRTAVQLCRKLTPDVVIMDVSLPVLNGIDATRLILESNPEIKVVVLSMHSDRRFVTEALAAGAAGYLVKSSTIEDILNAIHAVIDGQTYLSPQAATTVVSAYLGKEAEEDGTLYILTSRERQVLQMIAEGRRTNDIAEELALGIKTVESCRSQIMKKLNLKTVAELTKYAIRHGLTTIDF